MEVKMKDDIHKQIDNLLYQKTKATHLDNLTQGYKICARSEGKSENSIRATTTALGRLTGFLKAMDFSLDVTEITARELREFIIHLQNTNAFSCHHPFTPPQNKGLLGYSVNGYLRAIRAFWSWLMYEGYIMSNPFARIKIPKPPRKVIATFSPDQLNSIFRSINTITAAGYRDQTMILMLLDTGIRASELCGLTKKDINLDEGMIKVNGKGRKERMVPIGARVQRALWKYINRYRPKPANSLSPTLFLTLSAQPVSVNRLEAIVERYAKKAGISDVRCSPHVGNQQNETLF